MKIFVAVPTLGDVHTLLVKQLIDWNKRYPIVQYFTLNVCPVDRAREQIIDDFLSTDCDYLMMIDSDTVPQDDAIDKMLKADKDIVTGLTPIIKFDKDKMEYYRQYNAVDTDGVHLQPDKGLVESLGAGGSCLLIKRNVVEKMTRPLFRNTYEDDNGKQQFISEDIYFTTKARKEGFKTYADTSVICWHNKEVLW